MNVNSIKEWTVLRPIKSKLESDCVELLYVFGERGDEVIYVTIDGSVYSFGANRDGVLGLGHKNAVEEPTVVEKLCAKEIMLIQSNNYSINTIYDTINGSEEMCNYVLALTKFGQIYSWGSNGLECLGNGSVDDCYEPNLITALKDVHVIDVCCGIAHCLALTQSGEVYAWGYDANNDSLITTPTKVMAINVMKVVSIACGDNHSIALSESGVVYGWGFNNWGQLGVGNESDQNIPIKVYLNEQIVIKKICCGMNHTLLLSSSGDVYAFGANDCGQIGDGSHGYKLKPIKLNISAKIVDIYANHMSDISIAMSEGNQCYVWGINGFIRPKKVTQNTINDAYNHYKEILITLKPLYLSPDINERHRNSFDIEKYSDLKFKVEGKDIWVQKYYLKSVCKHFYNMFSNEWLENNTKEIEITQYSYSLYYSLLKYLYTNKVEIKVEEVIDLYDLANCYFEERLKHECKKIIRTKITVDNVCHLFTSALKHNFQEMQDFCVDFAFDKMRKIYDTNGFKALDANTSISLVKRVFLRSENFHITKKLKK